MSKHVNRKKRKNLTKDEVLDLLKLGEDGYDSIIDEYIFRFGKSFQTEEAHRISDLSNYKYDHTFVSILKDKLLK
jgi:hypothetical protein